MKKGRRLAVRTLGSQQIEQVAGGAYVRYGYASCDVCGYSNAFGDDDIDGRCPYCVAMGWA